MTLKKLNCWEYMKSDKEISQFIKKMGFRLVKAGVRFINQGEISNSVYIVKSGTCRLVIEKSGNLHPVSHLGKRRNYRYGVLADRRTPTCTF